MVDKKEEIIT